MDLYQRIQLYAKEIQHFMEVHPYGRFVSGKAQNPKKKYTFALIFICLYR